MRFQFSIVANFINETLRIFILTAIVGCPFSGYHLQIKAMQSASTAPSESSPSPSSSSSPSSSFATTAPEPTSFSPYYFATPTLTTTMPSHSIASFGHHHRQHHPQQQQQQHSPSTASPSNTNARRDFHSSQPKSDISNDSNEIDNMDYVMTKHIASHAVVVLPSSTHFNTNTNTNTTQDLSSLSLLSLNETTATSSLKLSEKQQQQHQQHQQQQQHRNASDHRSSTGSNSNNHNHHNNNNSATITTFQHIGSQRIALKSSSSSFSLSPTIATTATSNSSSGGSSNNSSSKSNIRTSAKKVDSKYILPKPQKTDAPMLNYIFDTFSSANKHHHHDQRYGPHFEDVQRVGQPTNLTVQAGSSIHLNCRISLLQDKTVSWVRRNAQGEENALDLLTVGLHTYTGDKRYKMEFQYPNNWRLKITNVKKDDEAMYECQISTHPPRVIQINLHVNAPKVMIVDEFGDPLQEKYYEIDSTLQLSCVVRNVAMATSVVYWKHADDVLNYDVTRGGVSVKTELMDDGANSTLFIAKINKADSGNYTCSISDFQNFSIVVHILNGESFAELHHGGAVAAVAHVTIYHTLAVSVILLISLLYLPAYINR